MDKALVPRPPSARRGLLAGSFLLLALAASLAGAGVTKPMASGRILFEPSAQELPPGPSPELDILVPLLTAGSLRGEVLAYASEGPEESSQNGASQIRRRALSRGLAVKAYLMHAGVPGSRVEVTPVGLAEDGGPADRVDVVVGEP